MINILMEEYKALKSEQLARIKIRDTLLYISLSIFGAIFSYVLFGENTNEKSIVLLAIPTVSFILGWTYVVNDEKISQIGKYIRQELAPKLENIINIENNNITVLGWENYHRNDSKRIWRKRLQVSIDLVTFIIPPIASVVIYFFILKPNDSTMLLTFLTYWDMFLLGWTIWFVAYFDHSERKKDD